MFFLLYRHTDDGVFDDFLMNLKIFQNCSKGQTNIPEHFPKISEDCRRLSRYNLREKLDISEIIDIFTSEDIEDTPLEFRM